MFSSQRIVRATMAHQIEPEAADRALDIALAVERSITCPKSGRVLDSRTAVGVWHADKFVAAIDPTAAEELQQTIPKDLVGAYVFDTAADVWEIIQ